MKGTRFSEAACSFFCAMMLPPMTRSCAAVILVLALACSGYSKSPNPPKAKPGQFDYYVLSLSWSPQYCSDPQHANRDKDQCGVGRKLAFVTHGLWPNNNRPPHPSTCAPRTTVAADLKKQMLAIMPSPALIQHEWEAHGTCSGLSQSDYFATIRSAFRLVTIPQPYREPATDLRVSADEIRSNFQRANAQFPQNSIRLDCGGQFLREIRICLDKELMPQVCASGIQDTCGNRVVTMRRVR